MGFLQFHNFNSTKIQYLWKNISLNSSLKWDAIFQRIYIFHEVLRISFKTVGVNFAEYYIAIYWIYKYYLVRKIENNS